MNRPPEKVRVYLNELSAPMAAEADARGISISAEIRRRCKEHDDLAATLADLLVKVDSFLMSIGEDASTYTLQRLGIAEASKVAERNAPQRDK